MRNDSQFSYEDAAERKSGIEGWVCKTCHRFWGEDKHMAHWCCAKDLPCKCGKRIVGSWTACKDCRDANDEAKWAAKPEVEWDGEFPLAIWDDDKFFWNEEEVYEWLADDVDDEDLADFDPLDFKWTTTRERKPREFDGSDYFTDYLHEDDDTDFSELEKFVDQWAKDHIPTMHEATGQRISRVSLIAGLDLENQWKEILKERNSS